MDTKQKLQELIELLKDTESHIEIKSDIARGGMGQVSLANDSSISRDIALKVLHDDLQKDETMCLQFVEEARITGLLEHSNIVPVHTVGINDEEKIYFTMKYVDGDSLLSVI
ncbi:MAG: protein kinase, partial [Lentisphaeraceae bacterium]|nr:protein kinase [Lentisphaeraceae bacterium]